MSDYGRTIIEGNEIDKNLLLTGPKGNGKGLLMHRLEEYLKEAGKMVENVKASELNKFRHRFYMNVDLMIIRSVEEVLKSSEKLQELVNVVEMLNKKNVPLVLTASIAEETIPGVYRLFIYRKTDELKIVTPSIYDRVCFVKQMEESFKLGLECKDIQRIAEKTKSMGHIIGALNLVGMEIKYMKYSLQKAIENVIG